MERSETKKLAGYYRNFGLSAFSDNDARSIISSEITDGIIDWPDSDMQKINLSEFDQEITFHCKKPSETGVWYTSGRSVFPEH